MLTETQYKACLHKDICNGCMFQGVEYEQELRFKGRFLARVARKNGMDRDIPLIPAPNRQFYRNKVELTFGIEEGIVLGYNSSKLKSVFDLKECLLFDEGIAAIKDAVISFASEHSLSPYDRKTHKGALRHLLLRRNTKGKMLVGLVATTQQAIDADGLVKSLSQFDNVSSIALILNDMLGDAITVQDINILYGPGYIDEEILGVQYRIGFETFFQVNPYAITILYQRVVDWVSGLGKPGLRILDLYAGSGGIGIQLAKAGHKVLGVEYNERSKDEAFANSARNGIEGYDFIVANVRAALGVHKEWQGAFDVVITDPPRSGMPIKVVNRIMRLESPFVVYISCNPVTFFSELALFQDAYEIEDLFAIDMFPFTGHMECACLLKKKDKEKAEL